MPESPRRGGKEALEHLSWCGRGGVERGNGEGLRDWGLRVAPEGEYGVDEEDNALDDADRALGDQFVVPGAVIAVDCQRARCDEEGASDDQEEQLDTSVNWCSHNSAGKEADKDDEVADKGSCEQEQFIARVPNYRMVMQSNQDAHQDDFEYFDDETLVDVRHFDLFGWVE
jgi:hypothetical protein